MDIFSRQGSIHRRNLSYKSIDTGTERRNLVMQKPTEIIVLVGVNCTILIFLYQHFAKAIVSAFAPGNNLRQLFNKYSFGGLIGSWLRLK